MVAIKGKAAQKGVPTLEELKKAGKERHIPGGYNYCGPGTQYALRRSGKYESMMKEAKKKLVGRKPYGKPINRLDSACQKHDKVYSNPKATADAVRKSDNRLAADAMRIAKSSSTPLTTRATAFATAKAFGLKAKAEDAGLIRKGAFAAGGEKKTVKQVVRDKAKDVIKKKVVPKVKKAVEKKAKDVASNIMRKAVPNVTQPVPVSKSGRTKERFSVGPVKRPTVDM